MGTSPSPIPWEPSPQDPLSERPPWIPVELPFWRREPRTRYVVLFLLTLASTTLLGVEHYASFQSGFSTPRFEGSLWTLAATGLFYSIPILLILGVHEFGHYFACMYYRVHASLPYFLPFPLFLTGTLGAVIRIRQPIPAKRALFDIGIAGPLAGFAVALPLLIVGMALSRVVAIPTAFEGALYELGEPLLFKLVAWLTFGDIPDGQTIILHPVAFAAWFGLIATALNLFPIGQLDGGHIAYAVLGPKSTAVTIATAASLIGLTFVSFSWILWAVLTIVMLLMLGPRHPRVVDEHIPLDRGRRALAALALGVFVVCFTPAPIEFVDLFPK